MKPANALALAVIVACLAGPATAGAPAKPIREFTATANSEHYICILGFQLAMLGSRTLTEAAACIDEGKAAISPLYTRVKTRLAKKPATLSMAKDYYASWLSSMDELLPKPGETRRLYDARQDAAQAHLKLVGERLSLEE